jgi:hypothetical protein
LAGALTTTLLTVLTVAFLAGVMATPEAQIVTLPPLTCEPTLLDPDDPPEFLQAAKTGSGAKLSKLNMTAKPKIEFTFAERVMAKRY